MKSGSANADRLNQIEQLDKNYNINPDLIDKLKLYFEHNKATSLHTENQFDIAYILRVLPANLKIKLIKFMFSSQINTIPLL